MTVDRERFESLDSLRGIAALTVLYSHINNDYFHLNTIPFIHKSPLHVFYDGEAAVVFFFVLSGFVLSYKYFKDDKFAKLSYVSFIVSRIYRIYPIFWFVMMLMVVIALYIPYHQAAIPISDWTQYWWTKNFELEPFLRQMSLVYMNPIEGNNYLPQAWTLRLEMIMSSMVPLFILMARYRSAWLIAFNVIMLAFFDASPFLMHFGMGILLAQYLPAVRSYMSGKKERFKIGLLLIGIFLYSYRYSVAVYFSHEGWWHDFIFGDFGVGINFIIGAGIVMILIAVLTSRRLQAILVHPVLLLIGRVSYSLYLCHFIILIVATPLFILGLNKIGITSLLVINPLIVVFTTLASVGLAYILYRSVEVWSIAAGRRATAL